MHTRQSYAGMKLHDIREKPFSLLIELVYNPKIRFPDQLERQYKSHTEQVNVKNDKAILCGRLIMRKALCYMFVLAVLAAGILGCHTIEGVGKDLQKGGEKIEELVK